MQLDCPHGARGYVLFRCRCDICSDGWMKLAGLAKNPSRMVRSAESYQVSRASLVFEHKWRRDYYKIPERDLIYHETGDANTHKWVIHKPTWTAGAATNSWLLAFCRMTRKDPFLEQWRLKRGGM